MSDLYTSYETSVALRDAGAPQEGGDHDWAEQEGTEPMLVRADCFLLPGEAELTDWRECARITAEECVGLLRGRDRESEAELAALREQTRVRNAMVEQPEVDEFVLSWNGSEWSPSSYRTTEDGDFYWSDEGGGTYEIHEYPFWLPMPPAPEPPEAK